MDASRRTPSSSSPSSSSPSAHGVVVVPKREKSTLSQSVEKGVVVVKKELPKSVSSPSLVRPGQVVVVGKDSINKKVVVVSEISKPPSPVVARAPEVTVVSKPAQPSSPSLPRLPSSSAVPSSRTSSTGSSSSPVHSPTSSTALQSRSSSTSSLLHSPSRSSSSPKLVSVTTSKPAPSVATAAQPQSLHKPKWDSAAKQLSAQDAGVAQAALRAQSAEGEAAWEGVGKVPGTVIWRIEKFKVVPWPTVEYGQFFDGDSYIVLHTYHKRPGSASLGWDIHFWLGDSTTADEAGTAAYKTVELDTALAGDAVQHREVQGHESDLFLSYFGAPIAILHGGVESGFRHVKPKEYKPRLLHFKGKRNVRAVQTALSSESLNDGDVFVLDLGLHIIQWNGGNSGPMERNKAATMCRAMVDDRQGVSVLSVMEEDDAKPEVFWSTLGGRRPIKPAQAGGDDVEFEHEHTFKKRLFHLSDATASLKFEEVIADKITQSLLDSNDAFILDDGVHVFAWVGKRASAQERQRALWYAEDYLARFGRPAHTSISRVVEGAENKLFCDAFDA